MNVELGVNELRLRRILKNRLRQATWSHWRSLFQDRSAEKRLVKFQVLKALKQNKLRELASKNQTQKHREKLKKHKVIQSWRRVIKTRKMAEALRKNSE